MARKYDPLKYIPSASVLRESLAQVEEEARRLRVVLRTAEQIEKTKGRIRDVAQRQGAAR